MPVILHEKIGNEGDLAVWNITEPVEKLMQLLKQHGIYADVPFFRNPSRLAEWLAVRILFAEMNIRQRIVYDSYGKPHLEGAGKFVSISHSGSYIAVIAHDKNKVGIDIEVTGDRIHRVSHKFVSDTEMKWISDSHKTEMLYIIWGAKECAFKIFGLGEVDFRDHMQVQPFDFKQQGRTEIVFSKNNEMSSYLVFYQYLPGLMITYAIAS